MTKKILIVDDEESLLHTFKEFLSELGYIVDTAQNIESALEKSENKDYDIAIVDMIINGSDSLGLIPKLRQESNNISVIVITGYPPQDYVAECFRLGAVDFITKPCELGDLQEAVERCSSQAGKTNNQPQPYYKWDQIFTENPSAIDTILKLARRKVRKEILKEATRCKKNFTCLLSENPDICSAERYIGEKVCFVKNNHGHNCLSNNHFSFGDAYFCSCPVRGELYKLYNI